MTDSRIEPDRGIMDRSIASGPSTTERVGKKAAKALNKVLEPGEHVVGVLSGLMGEALVGTDRGLHIYKRGAGVYSLEPQRVGQIEFDVRTGKVLVSQRYESGALQPLELKTILVDAKDYPVAEHVLAKLEELFDLGHKRSGLQPQPRRPLRAQEANQDEARQESQAAWSAEPAVERAIEGVKTPGAPREAPEPSPSATEHPRRNNAIVTPKQARWAIARARNRR